VDAAANASVLAGVDGTASSRQLIENNLYGTVNLLEYAKSHRAGFILLSTSRVYSIGALKALPLDVKDGAFELRRRADLPEGMSERGIAENFATTAPVSLYGSSKLCSELLALEYSEAFNVPVWINRCGALAGAGQFGRPDQGIFTYWINSYLRKKPLQYIGFAGSGHQVRDCFHPNDLASLIEKQMGSTSSEVNRLFNLGGGADNTMSLLNLTAWCQKRFGNHEISKNSDERTFDVPWVVLDSGSAHSKWDWQPTIKLEAILEEIAVHAEAHPNWLEICAQSK
jgi:CDP-paratose 2-epimerase